jgi:hypothetical protein
VHYASYELRSRDQRPVRRFYQAEYPKANPYETKDDNEADICTFVSQWYLRDSPVLIRYSGDVGPWLQELSLPKRLLRLASKEFTDRIPNRCIPVSNRNIETMADFLIPTKMNHRFSG